VQASIWSFVAFAIGGLVPLVPWFFMSGNGAIAASVALGAAGAIAVGILLSRLTGRPALRIAARQLTFAAIAAGVGYVLGRAIGLKSPT
jgi:VIT1/CCC1 family predicted Fe2+/Mn2+ transporter